MRAITIENPGKESRLAIAECPRLTPGPGEVLIRVAYAGVNRADLLQRSGLYPPPPGASELMGLEVSGEIAALGADVAGFKVGERVCALLSGGGYAEYALADAGHVLPVPDALSLRDAAALPEALATLWLCLKEEAQLAPGEVLYVPGGASGIGTTAIQLAKYWGNKVIVSAGTDEKCAACLKLGADAAFNYNTADLSAALATFHNGIDVVLDMTGGPNIPLHLSALNTGGRLVLIALQLGTKAEVNLAQLLSRRLKLIGSTLRSRPNHEKTHIIQRIAAQLWPAVVAGAVRPVVDSVFPLSQAEKAHAHMQQRLHIGKIVLEVGPSQ